jgi:nucleoside-diphosphate-sugar epimerase
MRIVVTGAAGFIGSHLCERLLAMGHEVLGVDAFRDNYPREIKDANLAAARDHAEFELAEIELVDDRLSALLADADVLFHLAARPGVRDPDNAAFKRENVQGTDATMRAAAEAGIRRVILASSSSVYAPSTQPHREDDVCEPLSPYGRSKLGAERVATQIAADRGLGLVILRYFTVYGPRQRPDMAFARFISAATDRDVPMPLFGAGNPVRDFTYVGDAVAATVLAVERGQPGGTYNVSGGQPTMLSDALEQLAELLQAKPALDPQPLDSHEQPATAADLTRARAELGYEPATGLSEGLARQVAAAAAPRPP